MESQMKKKQAGDESNAHQRPWLNLPIPITESILEQLPVPDYIRSSAVCTKFLSVHRDHPNLPSIPWLIPTDAPRNPQSQEQETLIPCYSPSEDHRFYRLPVPLPLHLPVSSRGWILLRHRTQQPWALSFSLLNPISHHCIPLPSLSPTLIPPVTAAAISAPDPDWSVLVCTGLFTYLLRNGDSGWTMVCFIPPNPRKTISVGGKFYCQGINNDAVVIVMDPRDPNLNETEFLEMDRSQLPASPSNLSVWVEFDGRLLLVIPVFTAKEDQEQEYYQITEFQVFEADFTGQTWVRMENLGDRLLLLGKNSPVSLLADDVGWRRNCIYFSEWLLGDPKYNWKVDWDAWMVFDLATKTVTSWPLSDVLSEDDCSLIKKNEWQWFVPSFK